MKSKKALIIVDIQNDFLPGGALGVAGGDEIVSIINRLQDKFDLIVATQDWHPKNHDSFASKHNLKPGDVVFLDGFEQILWPDHCIENSKGSEFAPGFKTEMLAATYHKGTDPHIDSYSAFFDNEKKRGTGLDKYLLEHEIKEVYLAGLTTEYCIRYSVFDAQSLGFDVSVIVDAIRPVELHPGDEEAAIEEMRKSGAHLVTSDEILKNPGF